MSFAAASDFVLGQEGGELVDDPSDPGGLTRWGISLNNHRNLTPQQIRDMTADQARAIYFSDYWMAIGGGSWPDEVQLPLLDTAVLQGPEAAVKCMQIALVVPDDGIAGPITFQAARDISNLKVTLSRFTAQRIDLFSDSAVWRKYRDGWDARAVLAALSA